MAEVNRLLEEGLSLVRRLVAEAQAAAELKARLKAEAEARAKAEEEARVKAEAEEAAAEAKAKAGAGDGGEPEAGGGPEGPAAAPLPSPPPSASTPSAPPSEASTATAPPVPPELLPRLVHQLLGFTVHPPDALALVNNEHFGPFIEECTVAAAGPTGHVQFPLHACSVLCNVCAYPSCRDALDPGMMLRATTEALHWFPRNRRLVHLALMTTANFAHCGPRLRLTAPAAEIVARAVIPLCDEAPVVDAWCCALTNLASIPDAAAALLTLGVVGRLQELLLYHGDARLTARGLRCVTAFASAGLPPS